MVLNPCTSSYDALYLVYICTKFHENILDGISYRAETILKGKTSKGNNSMKKGDGVTVIFLCTSSNGGLYLNKV